MDLKQRRKSAPAKVWSRIKSSNLGGLSSQDIIALRKLSIDNGRTLSSKRRGAHGDILSGLSKEEIQSIQEAGTVLCCTASRSASNSSSEQPPRFRRPGQANILEGLNLSDLQTLQKAGRILRHARRNSTDVSRENLLDSISDNSRFKQRREGICYVDPSVFTKGQRSRRDGETENNNTDVTIDSMDTDNTGKLDLSASTSSSLIMDFDEDI